MLMDRLLGRYVEDSSDEQLRVLIESLVGDLCIIGLDPNGFVHSWNGGAERMHGYRSEEILGRHVSHFYVEEDVVIGRPSSDLRLALESRCGSERLRRRADGSTFWANVKIAPHRDKHGVLKGFIEVTRDLTEGRLSEQKYRAVVEDQTEVVCRFRIDGTIIFVNEVYCRMFGKSADELLGTRWCPLAHPDDVSGIEARLRTLTPNSPLVRIENRVFDAEGRVRWMEFVNRGFFSVLGEVLEVQSVGRDITERILAEEELRNSEERMRLAMEGAQISTWDWDISTGKVIWSNNLESYLGLSAGTFGGTFEAFSRLVHPDDRKKIDDALKDALNERKLYEIEFRMIRPDGSIRWSSTKGRAIYDMHGRAVRMLGVDVDITTRKQAEDAVRKAIAERETLLKEVHHRVKNNLQVICSLLYLQSQHVQDRNSVQLFRESQSRVRAMALVHERLYRSKDFVSLDMGEYVENLANELFRSYQRDFQDIRLVVDVKRIHLTIDAAVPCGLLLNELVSNCLKHAFQAKTKGSIKIELAPTDSGEAFLSVSDDGVGLPVGIDPCAAETFGMQLILALVDQLHGRLEIDRKSGTSLRIFFPWRPSAS
jgi:PAS domain S-box-containing protein